MQEDADPRETSENDNTFKIGMEEVVEWFLEGL